eukprot:5483212-Pyramimonas_sp.AAC.1
MSDAAPTQEHRWLHCTCAMECGGTSIAPKPLARGLPHARRQAVAAARARRLDMRLAVASLRATN